MKLGDADSALKDAEQSLKEGHDFVKGLFQKAEALYAMGDFEFALVHYHRGNKLRPELNEFRLGIQKAREAIDNSIGSECILYLKCCIEFISIHSVERGSRGGGGRREEKSALRMTALIC